MNDVVWAVIVVILVAIAILFIFLYYTTLFSMVSPTECSSGTGTYGVRPNKTGTVTQTISGVTLGQAITNCDLDPVCTAFSYDCSSSTMYIIDTTKPILDSVLTDLYQTRTPKILPLTNIVPL